MSFLNDTFVDTEGTALTAHVSDSGHTWAGGPGVFAVSNGNTLIAGESGYIESSAIPPTADYYVDLEVKRITDPGGVPYLGAYIRADGSRQNGYYYSFVAGNNEAYVYSIVAGVLTAVGSGTVSIADGETKTIRFAAEGDQISIAVNGVVSFIGTNTDHVNPGLISIGTVGAGGTNSTGMHAVSVVAGTLGAILVKDYIAVDDAALFLSPQWIVAGGGTSAKTNAAGAYLKTKFTGNIFGLTVDTTSFVGLPADYLPRLAWSVDNKPWQSLSMELTHNPGDMQLATTAGIGTHTIEVVLSGMGLNIDRWATPINAWKLDAIYVEDGEAISAPDLRGPKRALFLGDSITEGVNSIGGTFNTASEDTTVTWPYLISAAMNWEHAQYGLGSRTFGQAGSGGVPNAEESVDYAWAGQLHDLTQYDYIISLYGTGAAADRPQDKMELWLQRIRTAAPAARIIVMLPTSTGNHGRLQAAVTAVGDPFTYVIGPIPNPEGLNQFVDSRFYSDTIHPNRQGHARMAAQYAVLLDKLLNPSGGGGPGGSASVGEF
jgi:lysophospholipase L1-like esterase